MNFNLYSVALLATLMIFSVSAISAESRSLEMNSNDNASIDSSLDNVTSESSVDIFARDTFKLDTIVCPFKAELDYEPGEIECSLLEVPENREDPKSRYIELHVVKISAQWSEEDEEKSAKLEAEDPEKAKAKPAAGKRSDPVVYLTGGPGAHALTYVKRFKDHGLVKHRDLYILEQRGIGFSDDFCEFYNARNPKLSDVDTFAANQMAGVEAAAQCARNAAKSGVDLSGYSTTENARDVKALRMALGFEQWNVWGISYGSILGQAYIKQDPQGIKAIALDAIMPLFARDDALFWRVAKWYDRDLKKLDEACVAHGDCAERFPELGQRIRQAAQSVMGNPIVVEVKDTEVYPSGKAYVFEDMAAMLPFMMLYEQSNYPALPAIIYAWSDIVERRDETYFKLLTQMTSNFFTSSPGMRDAILCNDGGKDSIKNSGLLDIKELPILGAAIGTEEALKRSAELCSIVGAEPRSASEYTMTETDLPALIIEGDMDPITPPPLAKAILPGFKNATYVEFPYAGHGPSRSVKCAGDMLNLFYDSPNTTPDLSCVESMELPDFVGPLFHTTFPAKIALTAIEDKKKLAGPGGWLVLSSLTLLISFIVLTIGPIGRWIDNRDAPRTFGARRAAWLTSSVAVATMIVFAIAASQTMKASEFLMLFGMVATAKWGAILGLFTGLLGLITVWLTIRSRLRLPMSFASLSGFLLTGFAAISLCLFMIVWDLSIF
ncbi:alpha/beta fold hydrolase [Aliikangiella marina]|uniref:Proline iminopeptidase n=1 Tax=Aliikangiella marina TaxID=1712262 RepID=A0A545T538_9GAMM|nr:alpha/beta fold hydrolase [Aliikangiella marina]TQV72336.1 alpha/beta fold hydrolase [Aliikangiella marina]